MVLIKRMIQEDEETLNECRICYDSVKYPKKYCLCSGSQGFIHEDCLIKSINSDNTETIDSLTLKKKCELCNHDIILKRRKTKEALFMNGVFYFIFFCLFIGLSFISKEFNYIKNIYQGAIALMMFVFILFIVSILIRFIIDKLNIYEYKITILEYVA